MPTDKRSEDEAFRRFLRRVWQDDVGPLLRDRQAAQRRRTARWGGKFAAAAGLAVDGLLHLRGRPFTRMLTVMGATVGALLPDAWDWEWLRTADCADRNTVGARVAAQAAALSWGDALALFGLTEQATETQLKHAWREISQRWHPDKARDDATRAEYHVRFVAYQQAYEHLRTAYGSGHLPRAV
ncbi:MAG: J domain-containing protein [Phycisphaerales bacterium]|nr:J domain-containing protein [Phycisphaerales bacterium]